MEENEAKVFSWDCKPNSIFRRFWNRLRLFVRDTINHFKKSNMESWAEIDGDEYAERKEIAATLV